MSTDADADELWDQEVAAEEVDKQERQRHTQRLAKASYAEAASAARESAVQQGFGIGFSVGLAAGMEWGQTHGRACALLLHHTLNLPETDERISALQEVYAQLYDLDSGDVADEATRILAQQPELEAAELLSDNRERQQALATEVEQLAQDLSRQH